VCGRYSLATPNPAQVRARFPVGESVEIGARYNVAPTDEVLAVTTNREGTPRGERLRWGLVPNWAKDSSGGFKMINARAETLMERSAYRKPFERFRCLIPADGFYEWQATGDRKRPFYVHAKSGEPLAFAGLWETWTGPNGEELDTAAIVTTRANKTLSAIHDRMPVIVPPDAFDLWLNTSEVDTTTATALIAPAPDSLLEAHEISTAVNRTANDNPKLLEPVVAGKLEPASAPKPATRVKRVKKDSGQGALF
jgi:putative SOS response-associated peptidase YedK